MERKHTFDAIAEQYEATRPGYQGKPLPPIEERIDEDRAELVENFASVETHRFPWTGRYTADEYLALIGTYSDHILIPDQAREGLFECMRACIERMGGRCERAYEAVLLLAM